MATSTLLQRLPAKGGLTFTDVAESHRRQVETFLAADTDIEAGDWVMFDVSKTGPEAVIFVDRAAIVANGNALVVGVALEASSAIGQRIKVVVSGYAANAKVTNSTAAGLGLVVDTAIGTGSAAAATDLTNACGVTLKASPAGPAAAVADVWVYNNF
jgi:hypothetical protein